MSKEIGVDPIMDGNLEKGYLSFSMEELDILTKLLEEKDTTNKKQVLEQFIELYKQKRSHASKKFLMAMIYEVYQDNFERINKLKELDLI